MEFHLHRPDEKIRPALQEKIDNLTKPKGSLGRLEDLALQIGWIQQTLTPSLHKPHNILFAADHGIVEEGVSKSPKEITWQQVLHFLKGGAGVNFLCHQHHFQLDIVDAGVDYDFDQNLAIWDQKVAKGTHNYRYESAMSDEQMELCLQRGAEVVSHVHNQGCNVVSFGEMGIGNTSSSSIWMHYFAQIPLQQCVGAGSGLNNAGIQHKYQVLQEAIENYTGDRTPHDIIRYFGGFEMVMAIGGMLRAAELGMVILIDGFIMTNCILAASQLHPEVLSYAIYGHSGDEIGHQLVLNHLKAQPLLQLNLRLGEGTGAICAYPILESAVHMIHEMDSFHKAAVTKYFDV